MEESGIFKKARHQCELEIMAAAHTVYLRQVREKGRRVLGPEHTIQPTAGNVCPARDGEGQYCASSRLLVKSRMPYKPGASRPARYLAAFSAPAAKTSLDWAQCRSSMISSFPAKSTS